MKKFLPLLIAAVLVGCHTVPAPTPKPATHIGVGDLFAISKALGALDVTVFDAVYELLPADHWQDYFPEDSHTYIEERYDCDDFAISAWARAREIHAASSTNKTGIAVGVIGLTYSDGTNFFYHAANITLLDDGELFIWDQNHRKKIGFPTDSKSQIVFIYW